MEHEVKIVSGPVSIIGWQSYDITHDMLEPAGAFSLSIGPSSPELARALRPDQHVQLYLDGTRILAGFIDDRAQACDKAGGSVLSISGRDMGGRLVDEAAPMVSFGGLGIVELARRMASPWIPVVTLSNAINRQLVTAGKRAKKGKVAFEPAPGATPAEAVAAWLAQEEQEKAAAAVIVAVAAAFPETKKKRTGPPPIDLAPKAPRKTKPGERRWQVLQHFLEEGKLLAWVAADGSSLFIGKPNYTQEPTYRFIEAPMGHPLAQVGNVERMNITDSVGECFSKITVRADREDKKGKLLYMSGVALDGPEPDGTGGRFIFPKFHVLMDQDVRSGKQAKIRAEREMTERNSGAHRVEIIVKGHAQWITGARIPTLYAFDTIARLTSITHGIDTDYLITRVRFSQDKQGGPVSTLSLVLKGTELTS